MDAIIESLTEALNASLGIPLTVFLLSMIPIAEARAAILFGVRMGLTPGAAFGWAFLGSSLLAPILLLILIPIINALSRTKLFSKLGKFLYDKFEKKSRSLGSPEQTGTSTEPTKKRFLSKTDLKKMAGTALFVAIPVPLTGVWTGSAVASIVKVGFVKGLIGIVVGNAVACGILTLVSYLFEPYLDWILLGFLIIAALVVIALIVKFILYKPDKDKNSDNRDTPEKE